MISLELSMVSKALKGKTIALSWILLSLFGISSNVAEMIWLSWADDERVIESKSGMYESDLLVQRSTFVHFNNYSILLAVIIVFSQ